MTRRLAQVATLCGVAFSQAACGSEAPHDNAPASIERTSSQEEEGVQIRIRAGEATLMARLDDNAAARDFAAMLPLRLTLKDYASTEKIADLPRKLATGAAPAGVDPEVGDIAYYAPWGNLAIYYRDFGYSRGLVRLGRIENAEALTSLDGPVIIEAAEQPGQGKNSFTGEAK